MAINPNPNVDPSIRGSVPQVKDLKNQFRDILFEEIGDVADMNLEPEIDKAVDRLLDAVSNMVALDPH